MKKIFSAATAVLLISFAAAPAARAEEAPAPEQAQTEHPAVETEQPAYIMDIMTTEGGSSAAGQPPGKNGAAAAPAKAGPKRHFVDLFLGSVSTDGDNVSATSSGSCFIFCGPAGDYGQYADYEDSTIVGMRIGAWLEDHPAIGIAGDFSYLNADAPGIPSAVIPGAVSEGVSAWYMPISLAFLVRVPLLRSEPVPEGRVQFYGGLMLSLVLGDIKVNGVGGTTTSLGTGMLAGIALHFPSIALFGEYRILNTDLDYDSADDDWSFDTTKISANMNTDQVIFGMSIKY